MRLLITTQAVDRDDQAMGFFHRWLEAFGTRCLRVHVVCLKEGEHRLSPNVSIHSLGKETGRSLFKYVSRFFRYAWSLRREYDAVFVHMNQEYVLLGGIFWRLSGKRIVLWRNHKKGSLLTRIASLLAHTVCYTSPDAYVAGFSNAIKMPIGIDTEVFKPRANSAERDSILFLGRLDAVKNPDVFLEALALLAKDSVLFKANVYGDPTPGREAYAETLRKRFAGTKGISFHPAVRNDETPALYASHAIYVNLTPSGSFDKTIGEAMASGCIVVAANEVLRGVIPNELIVGPADAGSVARGIRAALAMDAHARADLSARSRAYVLREHSLSLLTERLMSILNS